MFSIRPSFARLRRTIAWKTADHPGLAQPHPPSP